ncbi:MAG: hypothetical protein HYS59_00460 [Candidatus Vogelbacteria bacterium]|nr:hypothetical protein [Candidatus Vogelbacteria bacterium]
MPIESSKSSESVESEIELTRLDVAAELVRAREDLATFKNEMATGEADREFLKKRIIALREEGLFSTPMNDIVARIEGADEVWRNIQSCAEEILNPENHAESPR